MNSTAPPITQRPILGTFSKGADGAASLNFCTSGGRYCDRSCKHHPCNAAAGSTATCYALRAELRPDREELLHKLQRHEITDPAELVLRAFQEIQHRVNKGDTPPWLRISTNGSVPQPDEASWKFFDRLRLLLAYCREHNIPAHLPVETAEKAGVYRAALGRTTVVRESVGSVEDFLTARGPVSCTVGRRDQSRLERLADSERVAKMRSGKTRRHVIVCPAIAMRYRSPENKPSAKAKCGNCKACALARFDTVFPLH